MTKIEDLLLSDYFERIGCWWNSDCPDIRLPGTLKFQKQGDIELEVMGLLGGGLSESSGKLEIYGQLIDGTMVRLNRTIRVKWTIGAGNREVYKCMDVFASQTGDCFDSPIFKLELELSNLDRWLMIPLVESTFHFEGEREGETDYTLKSRPPLTLSTDIPGMDVQIAFHWTTKNDFLREVRINIKPTLIVTFVEGQSILSVSKIAHRFQNFFSLLIGEPCQILRHKIHGAEDVITWLVPRPTFRKVDPHAMLMPASYSAVREQMSKGLKRWFQIYDELTPVLDLFFADQHSPDQYVQTKFTQLIQAVEVYHRRRIESKSSQTDTQMINTIDEISRLLKSKSSDIKGRIMGAIGNCKSPGLKERISDVLGLVDEELVRKMIGDRKEFAKRIKDLRNFLTHHEGSARYKAPPLGEIVLLGQQLEVVLVSVLMQELFNITEYIQQALVRKYRFVEQHRVSLGQ